MTDTFKRILADLPQLSFDQRTTILNRIAAINSISGSSKLEGVTNKGQSSNGNYADVLVLDVIAATVQRMSGELTNHAALRKTQQYNAFKTKSEVLVTQLKSSKLSRTKLRTFLERAVYLLYLDLRKQSIPPTSRTLMMQVHRLPAIIDVSFPGYAAAGLLHWIVQNGR